MSVQSWQIPCPRCGWANSGALVRCAKCGQPLASRPGMLVAGQSLSQRADRVTSNKVAKPGGLLPRLIALIIDYLILGALTLPIDFLWASQLTPVKVESGAGPASSVDTLRGSLALQVTLAVLYLFYFAGSWTIMGATPGQLLMSLRVTNEKAGGIGFFRGVLRYLLFGLLAPFFFISAFMVGLSKNKRALHDLLAGTYVIQIVDRTDLTDATGLPPAFSGTPGTSPTPPIGLPPTPVPPAPAPAPPVAPVAAPSYSAPEAPAAYVPPPPYTPPPVPAQVSAPPVPEPAPAAPPMDFPDIPMTSVADVPPPPSHGGSGASDADLYAPPPMVDPTLSLDEFTAPAPAAPAEREIYSPAPAAVPTDLGPAHEGELPPIEFPPMAPPPDKK